MLLLRPNQSTDEPSGGLSAAFAGTTDRYTPIPLQESTDITLREDSLFWTGIRGEAEGTSLVAFLLPLDKFHPQATAWREQTGKSYWLENGTVRYYDREGQEQTAQLVDLQTQVRDELIVDRTFLLGTDSSGRDVLSRLLLGTRVSLSVGLMAVLVSLLLGVTLGALAGFFRGRVDDAVMWLVSVVWSIPTLLLAISIAFVLGEGFWQLFLAIGVSM